LKSVQPIAPPTDRKLSRLEWLIYMGIPLNQPLTPELERELTRSYSSYVQRFENHRYQLSRDQQRRLDGMKDRLAKSERSGVTGLKGLKETMDLYRDTLDVVAQGLVDEYDYSPDEARQLARTPPQYGENGEAAPGSRPITRFEWNPQYREMIGYIYGKSLRHHGEARGHTADDPLAGVPKAGLQQQPAQAGGPANRLQQLPPAQPLGANFGLPGAATPATVGPVGPTIPERMEPPRFGPPITRPTPTLPAPTQPVPAGKPHLKGLKPLPSETATNPQTGQQIMKDPRTGKWMVLDPATGQWRPYAAER
jgi:hypothetical protein